MIIKSITMNNFKSLINFKIDLEKFNCLVGLNGSGKSTVLQSIDFISQLMKGNVDGWFSERAWDINDIKFKLEEKQSKQVSFEVVFYIDSGHYIEWKGRFSGNLLYCTYEKIAEKADLDEEGKILLKVENKRYRLDAEKQTSDNDSREENISFKYSGSILSQLSDELISSVPLLVDVKEYIVNIKSLDLLSPYTLKENSRAIGDIGLGGERFPSFLKDFNDQEHSKLIEDMKLFYPQLDDFAIKGQRGGVKRIVFTENCEDKGIIEFDAKHINDGIVRVLAIIAQTQKHRSLVLFDEIENGINPELIRQLMQYLINCGAQVIVTTHSPMILNYIPMEAAKKSVNLLYKRNGETKTVKFLSLPETEWKTDMLGPGEIYVDTDLVKLTGNLASSNRESAI